MAFIAYHFHWSAEELLTLEHAERARWCRQISGINRRLNESSPSVPLESL